MSHGSIYAAHVSWILRKPHISLEDTGNMEQIRLYKPCTRIILTSTSFKRDLGNNQLYYNGYHELAYLHPNFFKPDDSVLSGLDLKKGQSYVIMRFVSWGASYDVGHKGTSMVNKIRALNEFLKFVRVFISRELEDKYGLVFNFSETLEDQERSIQKGVKILKDTTIREEWKHRRRKMLEETIDVTAFMVWFVEQYPQSIGIMKENENIANKLSQKGSKI